MQEIKYKLMEKARGYFISQDFSSSVSELKKLILLYENDLDVLTLFGNVMEGIFYQLDVEDFEGYSIDDVISTYKRILAIDPCNFYANSDIGDILLGQGKREEAKAFYLKAMSFSEGVGEEQLAHVRESLEDCD